MYRRIHDYPAGCGDKMTMSSQFHTMGLAIGHDIMDKGMGMKAKDPVRVMRLAMVVAILISTLIAYLPPFLLQGWRDDHR